MENVDGAMAQFTVAEGESQKSVAALSDLEGLEDAGEISPLKKLKQSKDGESDLMWVTNTCLLIFHIYVTSLYFLLYLCFICLQVNATQLSKTESGKEKEDVEVLSVDSTDDWVKISPQKSLADPIAKVKDAKSSNVILKTRLRLKSRELF